MDAERNPTADRILDAATELFADAGFSRTTIREIAARAQANSALIYYYFDSKEGLLEALVGRLQGMVRLNLERTALVDGEPAEQLEGFIRLQLGLIRSRAPLLRILLRELLNRNESMVAATRRAVEANLTIVEDVIRRGAASGAFRDVDPTRAARTLMGSLMMPLVLAPLLFGEETGGGSDALNEHIVDMYLNGLRRA